MQPVDIQHVGSELAVKWPDGSESFLPLKNLRLACPCAGCRGETDIMGNLYKMPAQPLTPASVQLREIIPVGTYGLQPVWADGHSTGIYSFEYLKQIGDTPIEG